MLHKIQESVKLLNREYLQSFSVSPESRTQDLQDIVLFLEERCRTEHTFFVHGRGNGKAEINGILSFFTDSLSGRPFMTGIQQVFREETIL